MNDCWLCELALIEKPRHLLSNHWQPRARSLYWQHSWLRDAMHAFAWNEEKYAKTLLFCWAVWVRRLYDVGESYPKKLTRATRYKWLMKKVGDANLTASFSSSVPEFLVGYSRWCYQRKRWKRKYFGSYVGAYAARWWENVDWRTSVLSVSVCRQDGMPVIVVVAPSPRASFSPWFIHILPVLRSINPSHSLWIFMKF